MFHKHAIEEKRKNFNASIDRQGERARARTAFRLEENWVANSFSFVQLMLKVINNRSSVEVDIELWVSFIWRRLQDSQIGWIWHDFSISCLGGAANLSHRSIAAWS